MGYDLSLIAAAATKDSTMPLSDENLNGDQMGGLTHSGRSGICHRAELGLCSGVSKHRCAGVQGL